MATNILMPALSPTMTEGTLARWLKKEGDTVKSGDTLMVMEAMKMENAIMAEVGGVVKAVKVKPPIIKTKLITREGFNALKAEHDELWFKKRPEVTKIVSWAASLGDRSENADYTMNKRLLRQIDSRIRYLRKRLEDLKIVDYSPQQAGRVFFGAWVENFHKILPLKTRIFLVGGLVCCQNSLTKK